MDWMILPDATPFVEVLARQVSSTSSVSSSTGTPTSTSATSTSSGAIPSTSDRGAIFSFSSSATPSPTGYSSSRRTIPQLVMEWVLAFVAVAILLSLVFLRFTQLRRRGRPITDLFSRRVPERPTSPNARPFHHSIRHPYGHPPGPAPLPQDLLPNQPLHTAIHSNALFTIPTLPTPGQTNREGRRGRRGVRGADTDAGGRRAGPVDAEEHGEGFEKEELPAYESGAKSGPPRYFDVMMGPGAFGSGAGYDRTANTSGVEMELTELNRHPADRPLGDPFVDGHEYDRNDANRPSTATGTASGTGLDSRDASPNPTSRTQEHQSETESTNNASREHITMPAPEPYTETH